VGLTFESVEVVPLTVLGLSLPSWLPNLKVNLPQLGLGLQRAVFGMSEDEDPRDAASNPAFFDVLYLDEVGTWACVGRAKQQHSNYKLLTTNRSSLLFAPGTSFALPFPFPFPRTSS